MARRRLGTALVGPLRTTLRRMGREMGLDRSEKAKVKDAILAGNTERVRDVVVSSSVIPGPIDLALAADESPRGRRPILAWLWANREELIKIIRGMVF